MTDYEVLPAREHWDQTNYAVACFLARYRDATLRAYKQDMLAYLRWCAERQLAPLAAERAHLELYLRWMESRGYAPATMGRRFGMLGLRISEACNADITDLAYDSGYELLAIMGKGHKPALIPLPVPVLRAVHDAINGRTAGPILLNNAGGRMTRAAATGRLRRLARKVGLERPISPHSLRRTFCTAGLVSGVPLRDMQYAMRHSDSRTTLRYDMSRANLDRHASHPVAAYLAGMAVD